MLSDFSYTLISNRGEGGDFTSICNEILDFQTHRYEVCLQDMLFLPGAWKTIREEANTIKIMPANIYYDSNGKVKWDVDGVKDGLRDSFQHPIHHYELECTIPPGFYSSPRQFVKAINKAIDDLVKSSPYNQLKLNGWFHYDSTEVARYTPEGMPFEKEIRQLNKIRGKLTWIATDPDKITRVKLCKEMSYLLGIIPTLTSYVPSLKHHWEGNLEDVDISRNNLTMLWVFADFIGTTMVANMRLPLLRLVPIQVGSGLFEHSIFTMQHYVPVRSAMIQQFRIYIRDRITKCNTESLEMEDRLVLTLHFRLRE